MGSIAPTLPLDVGGYHRGFKDSSSGLQGRRLRRRADLREAGQARAVRDERQCSRAPQQMDLRQSASPPTMTLLDRSTEPVMDEMQMPPEWKEGARAISSIPKFSHSRRSSTKTRGVGASFLERTTSTRKVLRRIREGARPDAVTRAADHRAAAASLVRALFARGSFDEG